jgi:CRP-like cAMP-binding protein
MKAVATRELYDDIVSQVRKMPAWGTLDDDALRELLSQAKTLVYDKGEFLFMEGDAPGDYYLLIHGTVKVMKHNVGGKSVTLAIMRAAETLGDMALYDRHPLTACAEAMDEVTVVVIKSEYVRKSISRNPALAEELIGNIVGRLKTIQDRVLEVLTCSVSERIIKILVPLSFQFGKVLPLTHQDIADLTGTSRETISRKMEMLQDQGVILTRRGRLVILDENKLKQLDLGEED